MGTPPQPPCYTRERRANPALPPGLLGEAFGGSTGLVGVEVNGGRWNVPIPTSSDLSQTVSGAAKPTSVSMWWRPILGRWCRGASWAGVSWAAR